MLFQHSMNIAHQLMPMYLITVHKNYSNVGLNVAKLLTLCDINNIIPHWRWINYKIIALFLCHQSYQVIVIIAVKIIIIVVKVTKIIILGELSTHILV